MESESTLNRGLRINADATGDTACLHLQGYIDLSTSARLRECASTYVAEGARILVLDASELSFMDSSGIAVLAGLQQQIQKVGGVLSIQDPSPALVRLLTLVRMDDLVSSTDL